MLLDYNYYVHLKYILDKYEYSNVEICNILHIEHIRFEPYSNREDYMAFINNIFRYYFDIFYNIPVYTKRNSIPLNKYITSNYNITLKNQDIVTDYDLFNYIITNDNKSREYYNLYIKKDIDLTKLLESIDSMLI